MGGVGGVRFIMQNRLKIITPLEPIYDPLDSLSGMTLMNFMPYLNMTQTAAYGIQYLQKWKRSNNAS